MPNPGPWTIYFEHTFLTNFADYTVNREFTSSSDWNNIRYLNNLKLIIIWKLWKHLTWGPIEAGLIWCIEVYPFSANKLLSLCLTIRLLRTNWASLAKIQYPKLKVVLHTIHFWIKSIKKEREEINLKNQVWNV